MPRPEKRFYEFGPFRLDITTRVLLRESEIVPLTPKALDMLLALVERRGELVGRQELLDAVWPDVHVEEGNLNSNIFHLRRALGEDNGGQNYIVTIPRRGYRFVAGVREIVVGQACEEKTIQPSMHHSQPAIRSLAVLPFKTLCAEGCNPHLGLGLADALITQLSNLRQLTVRPTSTVSKYRALEQDPAIAGYELGVEMVLEGGIQIAGGRVRVTVQLVSVADGAPFWAEKFDENFSDIFSIEDAISARVAEALIHQLGGDQRTSQTKPETKNNEVDQTLAWLERTDEDRLHWPVFLKVEPKPD
jgi:DNA-binding winged helix-turn-helix (wHTH) protein